MIIPVTTRTLAARIPGEVALVFRILEEEKFLAKNLPGYPEYCRKVLYRLVPFLW